MDERVALNQAHRKRSEAQLAYFRSALQLSEALTAAGVISACLEYADGAIRLHEDRTGEIVYQDASYGLGQIRGLIEALERTVRAARY